MALRRLNSSLVIAFCLYLVPLTSAEAIPPEQNRIRRMTISHKDFPVKDSSCPGPTAYYKGLGCTPISTDSSSTCPERYDCNSVKNIPADKCFVNGRLYNIGESLKEEDANPCDFECLCMSKPRAAGFDCAHMYCEYEPIRFGCYLKASLSKCCFSDEVCPEKPEDIATCVVDGKTYTDGELFKPPGEPDKMCVCHPDYKGENIEPFCANPKRPYNSPMFDNADKVHMDCAPVYYSDQSPATDYHLSYRCQNKYDVVIASTDSSSKSRDPNMTCKFGNLTMRVGDELNQGTSYSSDCVKCVCEVPPVPTCQRLPDDECDVTKG